MPATSRAALVIALALATPALAQTVTAPAAGPVAPVVLLKATPLPLADVRVTGGPLKHAQDLDADYLLKLNADSILARFRTQAGLEPKAPGYGGWEGAGRQLTGHIAGHYLSGLSYMFAATGDAKFKDRADYVVNELKTVQDKRGDGYIGAQLDNQATDGRVLYEQLAQGNIRGGAFDLNGMWSPWYVEHKIFGGLRDAYRLTGDKTALDVEIKFAAWCESVVGKLTDAQVARMLNTEFGGMNEVLADLYVDTGDNRWLTLSEKFQHLAVVEPLSRGQDNLGGKHGNTQVPKLLGSLERYLYTGNALDGDAAIFFWNAVVDHHTFATGGHGYDEYFGPPDKLSDMVDGTGQRVVNGGHDLRTDETCNVYNMLKMTRKLFALEPSDRYAGFLERGLYNHILASIDPNDGRMCYMVPIGQNVTHEYQNMFQSFTCCVGSGMESHALHADGIYYEAGDRLWINLFTPSAARWKSQKADIAIASDLPIGEIATIKMTVDAPKDLTLTLRRPAWAGEGFSVKVNNETIASAAKPGEYVDLKRTWKTGDSITLALPKALHTEPLPDNPHRVALMWGPLVLAGDLGAPGGRGRGRGAGATPDPTAAANSAGGALGATQPGATTGGGPVPATPPARGPAGPAPFLTFVTDQPIDKWLTPVEGKPAAFHAVATGAGATDITFVPFYQLPERRYAIYFDVYTPAEFAGRPFTPQVAPAAARGR